MNRCANCGRENKDQSNKIECNGQTYCSVSRANQHQGK